MKTDQTIGSPAKTRKQADEIWILYYGLNDSPNQGC